MTNWPLFCILSRNKEKKSGVDGFQKASLLSFDDKLYLCFSLKRFFFSEKRSILRFGHFPFSLKNKRGPALSRMWNGIFRYMSGEGVFSRTFYRLPRSGKADLGAIP